MRLLFVIAASTLALPFLLCGLLAAFVYTSCRLGFFYWEAVMDWVEGE